jgi:hypothetical protein
LRLWATVLGDSEFALRLLSVFGALLAGAGMIAAGQRVARFRQGGRDDAVMMGRVAGFYRNDARFVVIAYEGAPMHWGCITRQQSFRQDI